MIKNGKVPLSLGIGVLLFTFFLILALAGPVLAPWSIQKEDEDPVHFVGRGEDWDVIVAPAEPDGEHWFGTDKLGRDVLSLMLHGLRYTLFVSAAIAGLRLVVGTWLGLYGGMSDKGFRWLEGLGWLGKIPVIILLYFLMMRISIGSQLPVVELILLQSLLMVLLGIPVVATHVMNKVRQYRKRLSVSVSQQMGASRGWLIRKHMFPLLKEDLGVLLVHEMILVLNLIGQLSLFHIFLGGTDVRMGEGAEYYSMTHEWLGLLGQGRSAIYTFPWLVLFPLLSYILLVFSLYLISIGLEQKRERLYNRHPHL
ncbi:ABC transporter permease [Kroppenstedtia eburnea]|uniref:ABC transporter permease n=1 Tax=Kroppenstedtia eburnea TaxID=714067 RepID=UPI0036309D56